MLNIFALCDSFMEPVCLQWIITHITHKGLLTLILLHTYKHAHA